MTSFKLIKILSTAVILMISFWYFLNFSAIFMQQEVEVDPAPLTKMFLDIVDSIVNDKYVDALDLCHEALKIPLPKDVLHIHRKLYETLTKLINLLIQLNDLIANHDLGKPRIYVLIHELSVIRKELDETTNNYINRLSALFKDPTTRYIMTRSLLNSILSLKIKIDVVISRVIELYLGIEGQGITINLNHPPKVYGGEPFYVNITLFSITPIEGVNVTLVIRYGDVLSESKSFSATLNETLSVEITPPRAEDIVNLKLNPDILANAKVFAIAKAVIGNKTLVGCVLSNFTLTYLKPFIRISIPSYAHLGEDIKINISAMLEEPLNLSIYVNEVSNKSLVKSLSISSGEYFIILSALNLSIGYHRIIFVTQPKGKYLPYSFSYTLPIVLEKAVALINIKPFALVPISKPILELYVDTPTLYNVTVYINNKVVSRYVNLSSPRITVALDTPLTILFQKYNVVVEVQPNDVRYAPTVIESSIYILNIVSFVFITIFLAIALTTPSRIEYVVNLMKFIGSISKFTNKIKDISTVYTVNIVKHVFRKSKLVEMYRKIITIVSKYVEAPKDFETLREFYSRLYQTFSGYTLMLVKAFLELYEEDLYSAHSIDVDKAIKIVKRIEEIERR